MKGEASKEALSKEPPARLIKKLANARGARDVKQTELLSAQQRRIQAEIHVGRVYAEIKESFGGHSGGWTPWMTSSGCPDSQQVVTRALALAGAAKYRERDILAAPSLAEAKVIADRVVANEKAFEAHQSMDPPKLRLVNQPERASATEVGEPETKSAETPSAGTDGEPNPTIPPIAPSSPKAEPQSTSSLRADDDDVYKSVLEVINAISRAKGQVHYAEQPEGLRAQVSAELSEAARHVRQAVTLLHHANRSRP